MNLSISSTEATFVSTAHLLTSPKTRLSLFDLGDLTVRLKGVRLKGRYCWRRIGAGVASWFAIGQDVLRLEMVVCAEAIAYSKGIASRETTAGMEEIACWETIAGMEGIACCNRIPRTLYGASDHLPEGHSELRY